MLFPLFFFIAFAGGLSAIGDVPGFDFPSGYTAFQFVFVLLQSAAFGGVFTGFGSPATSRPASPAATCWPPPTAAGSSPATRSRRWSAPSSPGRSSPRSRWSPGWTSAAAAVDLFGLYGLAVLVNLAATLWAAGVAMRVRSIQGGPLMQFPVFLILFLAPVYVPLDLLSGWIHAVASVNPVTALLEAGRGFISGDPAWSASPSRSPSTFPILFASGPRRPRAPKPRADQRPGQEGGSRHSPPSQARSVWRTHALPPDRQSPPIWS